MDCRGLLCGMGNTGSMTSADELNEQYDADGSVTQVPERNDEVHAGESAVAQSRESAVTIPAGTVVLAATPIGNVGDASARLVALLERADIVAAEDTRRLYDLARRLGVYVNGRVIAYHDHNERDKADGLLDQVEQGATVLVVSDAGMPTINDPGLAIVRRAIERGLPVTCAPGRPPCSTRCACPACRPTASATKASCRARHSERVQHLRALKSERRTIVFYETLHRIDESMADLLDVLGPNRKMALCRELTKDYEQIRRGTIAEIRQSVVDDPPRGEMVLVIAGAFRGGGRRCRACNAVHRGSGGAVSRPRAGRQPAYQGRDFHRLSPNIRCLTARSPIASRSTMSVLAMKG